MSDELDRVQRQLDHLGHLRSGPGYGSLHSPDYTEREVAKKLHDAHDLLLLRLAALRPSRVSVYPYVIPPDTAAAPTKKCEMCHGTGHPGGKMGGPETGICGYCHGSGRVLI